MFNLKELTTVFASLSIKLNELQFHSECHPLFSDTMFLAEPRRAQAK